MNNSDKNLLPKVVVLILGILSVVMSVVRLIESFDPKEIVNAGLMILIMYYMFIGYKKPHGNLLRYLFFGEAAFAVFCFWHVGAIMIPNRALSWHDACVLASILLLTYVSGRLNKFNENKVLIGLSFILSLVADIAMSTTVLVSLPIENIKGLAALLAPFGKDIMILALGISYISRYKEHKEAGLED